MFLILLLFLSANLEGQFFEYGQDAGTLRWNQFDTPHYRVIFPRGLDSLSQQFARRLESYYPYLGEPLDHYHSRMPVIVHNESSFSNGVFVWAPKRLEIFTNPNPNSYNQDWLTQLALHEGRHAVQIDMLNQGVTRVLSFVGGEQIVGAMAGFLPYWYLEGDAVDAETRLSRSGRGRQPSFEMELKAQMLEAGRIYSYSKAMFGSYRHYIPNHYQLGYLMVRHGRRTYGDRFWIDFQEYAARKPYLLSPTYFSMRKYGVKSKHGFYENALNGYRKHWEQTDSLREHTYFEPWNGNPGKHYTHYRHPHPVSPSLVVAYKTGMDRIPEFVFLGKGGEEKRLFQPGFLNSGRVSFSGSHLVWDEFVPDTRWSNRNYSVIRTFEVATGKVRTLGRKTRYFSPVLSGDGARIAAIEQSRYQEFFLVILSLEGDLLYRIPSPDGRFIQHPAWMESDSALVVIRSDGSGKSIVTCDPSRGSWRKVFDAGLNDITHPAVSGTRIYFSATFSGIDNIYFHDLKTGETRQVTSSRFGAFHPQLSRNGESLFYSRYTSKGFRVAELPLSRAMEKPLSEAIDHTEQLDYYPTEEEEEMLQAVTLPDTTYPARPYRKALNLFRFHSWLPLYFDYLNPDFALTPGHLPVSPGVSLISQNLLSTAVSQLGYEYRDGNHFFHSGIQFKGRYPVVNLYADVGGEPNVLLLKEEADTSMQFPFNAGFTARTYVPLRLNTGKYLSLVQPSIDYRYRRDVQYIEEQDRYRSGAHYLYYRLFATAYLRQGQRDILPRFGMAAQLGYYHAPFDHRVYGAVSSWNLTAYLPGLLKHHSVRLGLQSQRQYPLNPNRPAFINLNRLPRGLRSVFGEQLNLYSMDYVLPLLYPDLEISFLAYLKRIRAALWLDHLAGSNVLVLDPSPGFMDREYTTLGIDLVADMHLLRISFPLSLGARYIYEPATGISRFEALYEIEID